MHESVKPHTMWNYSHVMSPTYFTQNPILFAIPTLYY